MKNRFSLALIPLTFLILSLQGCLNLNPLFSGGRGPLERHEIIPAESYWTKNEILVIDLTGVVSIEGSQGVFGVGGPGMLVELKDRLLEAKKNPRLKAVILRIDSPGGGVTASDLIYHELMEFKKDAKIPVVVMMQDVAASGGLYMAMAADEIYAYPTTLTGSIGVITMLPSFEGLSDKVGIEMRTIKSAKNKDLGSPWRSMSDEEKQIFQQMIDSMYQRFLKVVMDSRGPKGLTKENLATYGDGRVFDGATAEKIHLIDGILYTNEVVERTKKLAGITDASIVSYEYPYTFRGNIYATSDAPSPKLGSVLEKLGTIKVDLGLPHNLVSNTRFLYMWLP